MDLLNQVTDPLVSQATRQLHTQPNGSAGCHSNNDNLMPTIIAELFSIQYISHADVSLILLSQKEKSP